MNKLVKQLFEDSKVFIKSPKQRAHKIFPHFSPNIMLKLDATSHTMDGRTCKKYSHVSLVSLLH